ncbi:GNAT family protein [Streptomyces sp. MP131-18]|uniref:GNAT family N-acetyltransferase n=1 Tax=Streptomyces sp. MP131-18 TaxID=1857892 RepID=UPI00097C9ACF|nr:GNAT family protein [Streptomyces sp. MP131-18]ONK15407.1 putative ribosomal N-acetyltransferase YdaF [Streptomyces sp. MP131-18]
MHPVSRNSARLALRELTVDDVDAVHAIYGSPAATEHLSFEPLTREQVGHIVARSVVSAQAAPRAEYALAACERDGGRLVGYARLSLDSHGHQAATIGFALPPDSWGGGYGTEIVRALLALGFGDLRLHRIWAARSPVNTASGIVLDRAGFIQDGRIRHHVHVRGAWRDSLVHSIIRDEWAGAAARV